MKTLTLNFFKSLLVLMFFLFLFEVLLRLLGFTSFQFTNYNWRGLPVDNDSILTFKPRVGVFKKEINNKTVVFTNLKSGERLTDTLKDKLSLANINIYGCSFTYGYNITDTETFSYLLDKSIKEYNIRNYGVEGYGVQQFYLQLQQHITDKNKPLIAIINYASFHDNRNIALRSNRRNMYQSSGNDSILKQVMFPLFYLKKDSLIITQTKFDYKLFPLAKYSALFNQLDIIICKIHDYFVHPHKISEYTLLACAKLCKANNITLIVTGIFDDEITKKMLKALKEKGIYTLDISVPMNQKYKVYSTTPNDRHPNVLAHRVYANKILYYINKNIKLDL